jgi:choice-of-anchor B domain-containing protein
MRGARRGTARAALQAIVSLAALACSTQQPKHMTNPATGLPPMQPAMMLPVTMPPPGIAGSSPIGMVGTAGAAGTPSVPMMTVPPVVDAGPPPPPDGDKDGSPDSSDNCPMLANTDQKDGDGDAVGDACDDCPMIANEDQADADDDGKGDACACDNPVVPCTNGKAGPYSCLGVDLMARLSASDFGATSGNALWGWTDPDTGRKIGVMGLNNGTGFVDVTVPQCAKIVGKLPTATSNNVSRDVKVFDHYAIVVAEARNHGMQIFDLKTLGTDASTTPLKATANYTGTSANVVGHAHDVAVNEESGFVYIVGADSCKGGLHIVDFHDPRKPQFVNCVSENGYVHDVLCVSYKGPDIMRKDRELCFAAQGEDGSFTIVDVTDKSAPKTISRTPYANAGYSHQGWLTEDQAYFLFDDELDEMRQGNNTRTRIFDVRNISAPKLIGTYEGPTKAVDHNLTIKGNFVYEANYAEGLRILDLTDVANAKLKQVAFFDIYPMSDGPTFDGAWIAYPWFDNGSVIVSSTEGDFFVLRPDPAIVGEPGQ